MLVLEKLVKCFQVTFFKDVISYKLYEILITLQSKCVPFYHSYSGHAKIGRFFNS